MNETEVLLIIPDGFLSKLIHLINNVNIMNEGSATIKIEKISKRKEYAATPKKGVG